MGAPDPEPKRRMQKQENVARSQDLLMCFAMRAMSAKN